MKYDLEERTAKFSENIIDLCNSIKKNPVNEVLVKQLVRSATSIGANYCEANQASSKKDFVNKIFICKKESNETKYWLRLLIKENLNRKEELYRSSKEAHELTLIFSKIITSSKIKNLEIK